MKNPIDLIANEAGKRITASVFSLLLLTSLFAVIAGDNVIASAEESADGGVSRAEDFDSDELIAASGSNRFVVWEDNTPGNYDILVRRSTDNGATWQAAKNISDNPGNSHNPGIVVSGSNVYVVWLQIDSGGSLEDIFFRRSTDNGATWKPTVKITSIGTVGISTPQVIASGTNVYVVWEQVNGEIYIRRSTDSGATWKAAFNISNNPGPSQDEEIAVSGSNVYIVWSQSNSDGTQSDIFFRRSTDNGATWKPRVILSNSDQGVSRPSMSISGSNIHVVWNQADPAVGPNWYQVYIRSSANGGATWKTPKDLTSAKETFLPALVASSGANVYVTYESIAFDSSPDFYTDILFLSSNDNGGTWEPVVTIAQFVASNGANENGPWIGAAGSKVYVFWLNADFHFGEMYLRKSNDFGANWGPVSGNLNNKSRTPQEVQAVVSGSNIYLVWSNIWPFEVYFLRSTNSGTSWDTVDNISNNSGRSYDPAFGR
jgi:hypothetical protein